MVLEAGGRGREGKGGQTSGRGRGRVTLCCVWLLVSVHSPHVGHGHRCISLMALFPLRDLIRFRGGPPGVWKYFEISNISNTISPDILFQRVLSNVLFNTCVYFYSLCGWEKVHVEKHVLPSSVSLFFFLFSFSSFFLFFLFLSSCFQRERN